MSVTLYVPAWSAITNALATFEMRYVGFAAAKASQFAQLPPAFRNTGQFDSSVDTSPLPQFATSMNAYATSLPYENVQSRGPSIAMLLIGIENLGAPPAIEPVAVNEKSTAERAFPPMSFFGF